MTDENTQEGAVTTDIDDSKAVEEALGLNGDRPEHVPEKFWDPEKKAVRTDDVLKSYTNLEKRFGAFTGAPEKYDLPTLSEELTKAGIELVEDDPVLEAAREFAKGMNMNQDGFGKMVELYGMAKLAESKAMDEYQAEEMGKLGDNADRRLNNLNQWAAANLPEELAAEFKGLVYNAASVKILERLVSMTRNAKALPDGVQPSNNALIEKVKAMQFEKDEHGNRRINVDPEFRAEYQRLRGQAYPGTAGPVAVR